MDALPVVVPAVIIGAALTSAIFSALNPEDPRDSLVASFEEAHGSPEIDEVECGRGFAAGTLQLLSGDQLGPALMLAPDQRDQAGSCFAVFRLDDGYERIQGSVALGAPGFLLSGDSTGQSVVVTLSLDGEVSERIELGDATVHSFDISTIGADKFRIEVTPVSGGSPLVAIGALKFTPFVPA